MGAVNLGHAMMRAWASWLLSLFLRPWGAAAVGSGARMAFPRRLRGRRFVTIGAGSRIGAHSWLEAVTQYAGERFTPRIDIGRDVAIGRHATITAMGHLSIGDGCLFSEGVYISDTAHAAGGFSQLPVARRKLVLGGEVHIGPRCFLGFRACVLPGVTLGEGCVVGAHAVVTRSFDAGSVIAGVPARLIRTIDRS
jgi:carbonic anhydrase/acetyltransferase-like protein (isoleucine patch superfamily)